MTDFQSIQTALRELPKTDRLQAALADRSCEQLRRAVLALSTNKDSVGEGDLAGLVRQVLRRGTLLGDDEYLLTVPSSPPWPNENLWRESRVEVAASDYQSFRLRASKAWAADWLADSESFSPFEATLREEYRRKGWPTSPHLPLDTALEHGLGLPFKGYQGPGQRLAIRSAFFLKPGGTLVVNLPTGTGKSLVAWAPALLSAPRELTVMITPTIALAIDQERQLRENYPHVPGGLPDEMAWHSGLSDGARKAIRQRLRDNTQRILITSPESFVGSLSRVLYKTAESGLLKYFVVDEAHLVAQWGNDFRPEFQAMSGLRRELIKRCPSGRAFRTLLLSATLTQESFDVLETLFSDGQFDSVNAVALRPEPEYWQSASATKAERDRKVTELVRVAPRPFLLYVTTKRDADSWHQKIRALGIKRSGCVHGGTSNEERECVIDRWRAGDIDCVVATSAFGLGMDKSDVRTVIHACIPESIDRYYQEVGRAGRDGCASVSILLPCEDADKATAKSISQDRIISLEKGRERWDDLLKAGNFLTEKQIWRVNLNTRPTHIHQDSDANVAWNLRTLVLLNRAGIIRLESEEPPDTQRIDGESDNEFEARRQKATDEYFATAYLTILNDGHLNEEVWETIVQPERSRMYAASRESFDRMNHLLEGNREIGELLRDTYTVRTANGGPRPEHCCSGCPSCRASGMETSHRFSHPEPDLVECIEHGDVAALQSLFCIQAPVAFVSITNYDSERERVKLCLGIICQLVGRGVDEIALPVAWQKKREWKSIHDSSPRRLVVGSCLSSYDPRKNDLRLPRATFLFDTPTPVIPRDLINMERPFHIILAPEDAVDSATGRKFFSTRPNIRDYELVQRLGQ
ncbi:protein DpdF [Allorhodopirellula solitaria]|uniref:DNA 3'-5' helicase n=1 Tax=Allorhodopirellula solitaria TaxID=2527987 RepID=A0A5C5WN72_9BACT|nr:protein DpdF [Allorhodopirellula solitaria]TWT52264.1 ATP-dependent DNA helicase RecQ [Allorhodopirellula solitaria]